MTTSHSPAAPAHGDFLGHPKGVYICFFTEMWERFSFYGMKALLLLYLTKYHLFSDNAGLDLLGAYGGLVYCIPVIGGLFGTQKNSKVRRETIILITPTIVRDAQEAADLTDEYSRRFRAMEPLQQPPSKRK